VLIAGLLLGGALAIRDKHGMTGGAAIGLAAGCKASPVALGAVPLLARTPRCSGNGSSRCSIN
jgi:hypothetical protein